jgi:hypothetical protein
VRRECFTNHVPPAAPVHCNAGGGAQWKLDPYLLPDRQLQVLTGVPAGTGNFTPSQQIDRGVLFITGNVGLQGMEFGLRQCPNIAGPGVAPNINYCQGVTTAIYNDPADPLQGARWTVAADGNIFLTGHLILQRDPRAADLAFTAPVPGPGDDLDVQNVLGVISWGGGLRMSSWLSPANLANRYPGIDNANLYLQGMFMAPAINGGAAPIGQLSFDDSNGAYRGQARLLGGVIQKTMGTLGSPGTPGTGYARDWVYDERYRHRGMSPPLFPGFPRFTATGGPGKDDFTFRSGSF